MRINGIEGECYFHVVKEGRRLGYADNRWVRIGRWMRARERFPGGWKYVTEPKHCAPAMHACKTIKGLRLWADLWAGGYVSICQLRGKVAHQGYKSHALERKVLFIRKIRTLTDEGFLGNAPSRLVVKWIMNPHLNAVSLGRSWKLVKRAEK